MISHNILNNENNENVVILNNVYTLNDILPTQNIVETRNFLIIKEKETTILSIDKRCGLICLFIKACEKMKTIGLEIERYLRENKLDYKIYNIQ